MTKVLDGALGVFEIDNRVRYGLISDTFQSRLSH